MSIKETFSKRKIGKQLVSVAMLGLLLTPVVLSSANAVNADEKSSTSAQTIDVDKQLEESVAKAKSLGVEIKTGQKKTFQSKSELDAFKADMLKKTNEAIAAAEKAKADVETTKAANQKANDDYQKALAEYRVKKAEYDRQIVTYNAQLEELKKLSKQEGYLSEAIGQSLIFETEPTAALKTETTGTPAGPNLFRLKKGQTVTATYTNLKNSSYSGEKIGKVVYTYTANDDEDLVEVKTDPTMTVWIKNSGAPSKSITSNVHFKAQFYDTTGKLITFSDKNPAIFSLNSLNRSKLEVGVGRGESVVNLSRNARFVPITGSEVVQDGNWIYSRVYNDYPANGSRFGANEGIDKNYWDGPDRPNRWYGAGTAILTTGNSVEFDIVNESKNAERATHAEYWFAFNSKVATARVVEKPAEPKAPEKPQQKLTNNTTEKISVEISPASLVITKHIDITTGKELHPQEEGTKPKRSFDGYEFVETKTQDGNTIHYYKPIDKTPIKPKEDKPVKKVHTRHYDITTGKELTKEEEGTQPKRQFDGYEFVETKTKDGDTEHYYKPVQKPVKKVITKYIDKDTGKELIPQEDGTQPKKDIPGYRFVETKDEDGNTIHYYQRVHTRHYDITTGKELAPQEDGTQPKREFNGYEFVETKDKDGDTEHFYRPIKKVTTVWITKDGKVLKEKTEGTLPKEDFDGYEFVETKTDEDGNTTHIYQPIVKVITKHIDITTGKELAPQEDGKQPKKEIEGYEFVETKDEDGNTIHYYKPITKVITKHIDIDTNEEIAPQEDGKQPKKDIEGYEFVETKDDKGNTLHYYRKVKKPVEIKGKTPTPTKYADTNEVASAIPTILGILGLSGLGSFEFMKRRKR